MTSGLLQRILDIFGGKDFNGNWISFHSSKHLKMQGRSDITYSSNDIFSWLLSILEQVGFGFVEPVVSIICRSKFGACGGMLESFWEQVLSFVHIFCHILKPPPQLRPNPSLNLG